MDKKVLADYQKRIGLFLLLTLSLVSVFWMFSANNSFCYDDTTLLERASFSTYEELFTFFPRATYMDRPIGVMFLKLLYDLFGLDAGRHHAVLVLLHMGNVYIVTLLLRQVFARGGHSESQAFLGALIAAGFFGIWTRVHMAVQWDSAIFDLLGTFFSLISCWFYLRYRNKKAYRGQNLLLALFFFFLAARTKEMFLTLPLLWLLYELWEMLMEKKWRCPTAAVLAGNAIFLGLLCILLYYKTQDAGMLTNDPSNPYYQSFSPVDLFKTLLKYGSLCFDMETPQWGYAFSYSGTAGLIMTLAGLAAAVVLAFRRRFGLLLCYAAVGASISAVLPMVNHIHTLYLYFPSIFVGAIIACAVLAIPRFEWVYHITLALLFGFILSVNSPANVQTIDYWFSIAQMEKTAWDDIQEIPAPPAAATIYIRNMDGIEYTPFYYANGGVCRLLYRDRTLNVQFVGADETVAPEGEYAIWEYQNTHVREVERSGGSAPLSVSNIYLAPEGDTLMIGITCSNITRSLQILLDGKPCTTTVGETFLSAAVPRAVMLGEQITLQVIDPLLGRQSAIYEVTLTGEVQSLLTGNAPEDGSAWRIIRNEIAV